MTDLIKQRHPMPKHASMLPLASCGVVLSADRPFTESEVKFLRYIREWGKKVIFIVNKIDILSSTAEEEEVSRFVADSAARMLGVQVHVLSSHPAASMSPLCCGGPASLGYCKARCSSWQITCAATAADSREAVCTWHAPSQRHM